MSKWAAIIPTRGQQRKVFTGWAVHRAVQNGYDHVYLIDYNPVDNLVDMYKRISVGVEQAIKDGCEFVSIIEDDDWYSIDYLKTLKKLPPTWDIVGINHSTYYHLFSTGWKKMVHPGRAGLFCTSFRPEILDKLPDTKTAFLDLGWWRIANNNPKISTKLIDTDLALGIKHGVGISGGNGHSMAYQTFDTRLQKLQSTVDKEAFRFYEKLREDLIQTWKYANNKRKGVP